MVKIKRLIIILVFLLPSKLYTQVSLLDKSKEQSWFVFSGAFCGGGSSAYDTCGQGSKLIELGAFMKHAYGGWISSIPEITESGTYNLNPLTSSTNNCFKIPIMYSYDYLIVEYRKKTGTFEGSLPNSGLLIYRIMAQPPPIRERWCRRDRRSGG